MDAMTNNRGSALESDLLQTGATIAQVAKGLFPTKSWAFLSDLLGLSEGGAKHKLACRREFTAGELAVLLRTEHGLDYLTAIMGDSRPVWWRNFKRQMAIADARKHERAARRRLQEAVHATDDIETAIARAETALAVSDEDFHRPQLDALGHTRRIRDRALAPRGRR